jgi:nitrilase
MMVPFCVYAWRSRSGSLRHGHVLMRGGSVIVDPLGQVLAGPDFNGETILTAELDMRRIVHGKFDFDVAGHYARPDVFRLDVDGRPKVPVLTHGGTP